MRQHDRGRSVAAISCAATLRRAESPDGGPSAITQAREVRRSPRPPLEALGIRRASHRDEAAPASVLRTRSSPRMLLTTSPGLRRARSAFFAVGPGRRVHLRLSIDRGEGAEHARRAAHARLHLIFGARLYEIPPGGVEVVPCRPVRPLPSTWRPVVARTMKLGARPSLCYGDKRPHSDLSIPCGRAPRRRAGCLPTSGLLARHFCGSVAGRLPNRAPRHSVGDRRAMAQPSHRLASLRWHSLIDAGVPRRALWLWCGCRHRTLRRPRPPPPRRAGAERRAGRGDGDRLLRRSTSRAQAARDRRLNSFSDDRRDLTTTRARRDNARAGGDRELALLQPSRSR